MKYIQYLYSPHAVIITNAVGTPEDVPLLSIFLSVSNPFITLPKTTCFPSK